jgi:hypothetical protein
MPAQKVFVDVTALHTKDNKTQPLSLVFNDKTYEIDRVKDVRRAAASKTGGAGIRYTVMIGGKESYIFEDDGLWFVEARQ